MPRRPKRHQPTTVLETQRLVLRHFTPDDDAFTLSLVNDPDFVRFVGDRGLRTFRQARDYLTDGPLDSYEAHGFGGYVVQLRDGTPVGMCGLLKRDQLDAPDLGFAFLAEHRGKGYALESAIAVLEYERATHGLDRVLAIVSRENTRSIALLEKLGFTEEDEGIRFGDEGPELAVYALVG